MNGHGEEGVMKGLLDLKQTLSEMLDRPNEWTSGEYTLDHKSGVSLWMGNGRLAFGTYSPAKVWMPFSWGLWRKAQRVKRHLVASRFKATVPLPAADPLAGAGMEGEVG